MYLFMYLLKVLLNYLLHYYITWKNTSLEILKNQKSKGLDEQCIPGFHLLVSTANNRNIYTTGIAHNN